MTLPSVTIITPHIAERELARIRDLVAAQTYPGPLAHVVVFDGPSFDGAQPQDILLPERHHDRGTFAINHAVARCTTDLCLQVADDDWIDPTAIDKLVSCWLAKPVDFVHPHMKCFADNGGDQGCVTGDPIEKWNLTSGLFRPSMFAVANMDHGPSGTYTQPGADGQMVYDWLQAGYTMTILPEIVLKHWGG